MDAPSVNQLLQEFANRHVHYLQAVSNKQVQQMLTLLKGMDADVLGQLATASDQFNQQRLESLLMQVRHVLIPIYDQFGRKMQADLVSLVDSEIQQQAEALVKATTGGIALNMAIYAPAPEQVFSAAAAEPMQGRLLGTWFDSLAEGAQQRISDTTQMGYASGQTTEEIVPRVQDVFPMIQNDAEAVVRTAMSHFANFARDGVFQANPHIVNRLQWVSTLDGRTTLQWCIPRAGKIYDAETYEPIGHDLPWGAGPGRIHWNCRSTSVSVTADAENTMLDQEQPPPGMRPYVAFQAPLDKDGDPIAMPKPASKMSVLEYGRLLRANGYTAAEARAVESRFIGTVPDTLSYSDFLKQEAAKQGGTQFVTEVLGNTRAKLFLNGNLPITRFVNNQGYLLTLEEVKQRNAAAWQRAFGE